MSGLHLQEQLDLQCEREAGNSKDAYAVAVQKDGLTLGHVLRTITCIRSIFVQQGH